MKKKFATILIALIAALSLTGCADGSSKDGLGGDASVPDTPTTPVIPVDPPDNPDDPVDPPDNPDDPTDTDCTVTLYYDGKVFYPDDTVQAQWTKMNTLGEVVGIPVTAKFNKDGVATAKDLDGNYKVALTNAPKGYTYNPNLEDYNANSKNNRHINIELDKLNVTKNDGSNYYTKRIVLENIKEGNNVYKINIKNASQEVYFSFTPAKNGVYTFESWADVTQNEVNPKMCLYSGSGSYIAPTPHTILDDGGISGSYTKNFAYTLNFDQSSVRATIPFTVKATSSKSYPVSFNFCLKYTGPYSIDDQYKEVLPQEFMPILNDADYEAKLAEVQKTGNQAEIDEFLATYKKFSESSDAVSNKKLAAQTLIYQFGTTRHDFPETGKNMLSDKNIKLNPEDGYYHFYDSEAETYGAVICASFTANTRCMVPNPDYGTGLMNTSVPRKLKGKDYTKFINSYYAVYAVNGYYPVTAELKEYLQAYAKSQGWFFDGKGWLETGNPGISSTEAGQWLACCVYFN